MSIKEKFNNLFNKKEEITNPAEEIKNTTEVEASQEEEISPERIEALQELDNEMQEIAKLNEEDLKTGFESEGEAKELGSKLDLLSELADKIGDSLSEKAKSAISALKKLGKGLVLHAPELIAGAVAVGSVAYTALNVSPDYGYAEFRPDMLPTLIASATTAVSGILSGGLYLYRKMDRNGELDSAKKNIDNSHEAIAA